MKNAVDNPNDIEILRLKITDLDLRITGDHQDLTELGEKLESMAQKNIDFDELDGENGNCYPSAIGSCEVDGVMFEILIDHSSFFVEGSPNPTSNYLPIYSVFVTHCGGDFDGKIEIPHISRDDEGREMFREALVDAIESDPFTQEVIDEMDSIARDVSDIFKMHAAADDEE